MSENLRKDFANLEEAFALLPQPVQEHSIRVGEYMRVLFLQACVADIYEDDEKAFIVLDEEHCELAPLIGRYHDIGKALVPAEYHRLEADFSPEEIALYHKHAADSARMVYALGVRDQQIDEEEWTMAREALASHHERWNGAGYPAKLSGKNIHILGRILAVANALDHFAAEKRSEQPMEYAIEQIHARSRTMYDPKVVELLKPAKSKLKRIFNSYLSQSRAIPTTETFIRRSSTRPFALWYRPIAQRKDEQTEAYEAVIRFRDKKEWQEYDAVSHLIRREKMENELGIYMMIEACDTINRLDTCRIPAEYVALELPTGWLNRRGAYHDVAQVLAETDVDAKRLCIVVAERTWSVQTKTMIENLRKLSGLECRTMISGVSLDDFNEQTMIDIGISDYRLTTPMVEEADGQALAERLAKLTEAGIVLHADGIEKQRYQPLLNKLGVQCTAGILSGAFVSENEMVERGLAEPISAGLIAAEPAAEELPASE
ncbi:MAG: EAL domain-containing protein [Oscillospiraceae bacterium]|nr:EAL domain-containing protein [Oscillospiraceae bacterium]